MKNDITKMYIKLNDELLIKVISDEWISINDNDEIINLKSKNVKYISPIIKELYQYNTISHLYVLLKARSEMDDINIENFTNILYKLINNNILKYTSADMLNKYMIYDKSVNNRHSLVIYSFIRPEQLNPLLDVLENSNFGSIRIVSFLPPLNESFKLIDDDVELKSVTYEELHISDINEFEKQLNYVDEDALVTVQSSKYNVLFNKIINKYSLTHMTPWINITITPRTVEIGPFVVNHFLGNYEYYLERNDMLRQYENDFFIRENLIKVNERMRFAYSFLINEITTFFSCSIGAVTPRTINKMLIFNNQKEVVDVIDVLRIDNQSVQFYENCERT